MLLKGERLAILDGATWVNILYYGHLARWENLLY